MQSTSLLPLAFAAALAAQVAAPPPGEATARIAGRVVDLRGEPVPAAEVWVTTGYDPQVLARTRADGEGLFLLAHVPQRDWWNVHATAEGLVVGCEHFGRRYGPVTVNLHDAAVVTGTLCDHAGKPVAKAPVRATLHHSRILFRVLSDAVTGEDGSFRLDKVPIGQVDVRAIVPGEGMAAAQLQVIGPCAVALQGGALPPTSVSLQVTGLSAAALAEARVLLLPYDGGSLQTLPPPWDHPRLAADGTLSIDGLPQFEYRISVAAKGFVFAPSELRVKGAGPHHMQFAATALGAGTPWSGVVLDAKKQPVAGVRLQLRGERDSYGVEVVSDAQGALTFACPLPAGSMAFVDAQDDRYVVTAAQGGEVDEQRRSLVLVHDGREPVVFDQKATLEVQVAAACVVEGRVLLADGRPAACVDVRVGGDVPGRWPSWVAFGYGSTDREGRFRIGGIAARDGGMRVQVEGSAGSGTSDLFAVAEPGTAVTGIEVKLSPPASIAGVLKDATGALCPGVRVWLRDWDLAKGNQRSGSVTEVLTDRLGRYRFVGVPAGGAILQLPTEERGAKVTMSEPVDVQPGSASTVDLVLPAR
jgi:RNase P/RNase MRP subunit p29